MENIEKNSDISTNSRNNLFLTEKFDVKEASTLLGTQEIKEELFEASINSNCDDTVEEGIEESSLKEEIKEEFLEVPTSFVSEGVEKSECGSDDSAEAMQEDSYQSKKKCRPSNKRVCNQGRNLKRFSRTASVRKTFKCNSRSYQTRRKGEVITEPSEVLSPEDVLPPTPSATVPEHEADTEDNGDWTDIPRTDADTSDEEGHHDGVRTGRRKPLQLPADVERELGEWLQENTFLYDRSLNEYRNKPRKDRVRAEKGATLNPPLSGDDIERWIKGMRTRYGKLTKLKSGSGSKTLTQRDKWILDLFGFLGKHIVRQKTPKTLGLKESAAVAALAPTPTPVPQAPRPSTSTSDTTSSANVSSSTSTPPIPSDEAAPLGSLEGAQQASKRRRQFSDYPQATEHLALEKIFERHNTAMERFLENQLQQKEAKRDRDVEWWRSSLTDFIAHQLRPVHRSYLIDLVVETANVTRKYVTLSRKRFGDPEEASQGPVPSSMATPPPTPTQTSASNGPPPPSSTPGSSTPRPPSLPGNPGFTHQ